MSRKPSGESPKAQGSRLKAEGSTSHEHKAQRRIIFT